MSSLRADVQNLAGIINLLTDDVIKGEEEKEKLVKKREKRKAKDVSSSETRPSSTLPSPSATVDQPASSSVAAEA